MDTRAFEKMEHDGWADPAIARSYADGFEAATRTVAQRLADHVLAAPGAEILDLCTGHGVVAAELVRRGAGVTALDFSPAMIALATANVPRATVVQGNAMAMDFDDARFDAVTIGFGIPHLPDPAAGLAEVARVLKPGGRLAFSIWRGKGSSGAFGWLFDAVGRLGDPTVQLPQGPDAHVFADPTHANPILADAGFVDMNAAEIPSAVWVQTPEGLFDMFDRGAVRAAALLSGQPDALRDAMRAAMAGRVRSEGTAQNGGYLAPAPSVIVTARRAP